MNLEDLKIEKLIVHKIGNKMRDEGYTISQDLHDLSDSRVKDLLLKYFLKSFKHEIYYQFSHESKLDLNAVYYFVKGIFENNNNFTEYSTNILKHLYEKSNHPQIKSGELYITYFKNYTDIGTKIDAIGIFKSENKDTYLKINQEKENLKIIYDKGININRLDKGCLIFNEDSQDGFKVLLVDTAANSQENEAQYWKKSFLNLKELKNEIYHTKSFIQICNSFSKVIYNHSQENEIENSVNFKNASYKYLEENTTYNLDDFVNKVFKNEKMKEEFRSFNSHFEETHDYALDNSFEISKNTVTQLKKKFNSSIKLDTGFDIKIVNTDYLEKGYDQEKAMKYYKIYYNDEK